MERYWFSNQHHNIIISSVESFLAFLATAHWWLIPTISQCDFKYMLKRDLVVFCLENRRMSLRFICWYVFFTNMDELNPSVDK